jgi:hypothetical protein
MHGSEVFKNTVLRKLFGRKRDTVIGRGRNLHNEKLQNWHFSADIIGMAK